MGRDSCGSNGGVSSNGGGGYGNVGRRMVVVVMVVWGSDVVCQGQELDNGVGGNGASGFSSDNHITSRTALEFSKHFCVVSHGYRRKWIGFTV